MNSGFLTLNTQDFIKGLIVAVLMSALQIVYATLSSGTFTFDWMAILQAGVTAGVAYLMKNLFTNQEGQFAKK
jgi:hypothetical protein